MNAFLKQIADAISANLITPLTQSIADQAVPVLVAAVAAEFERQTPMLVEAVVRAVATSTGDLISRTTDNATDMIPGELDDVVDGWVKQVMTGLFGTNEPRRP
jgi:hypothetical protein